MTKDSISCDLDPALEAKGVQEMIAALSPAEKKALADEDMPLRHFRAEKGDATKALKQLQATLAWRKEFQLDALRDCFLSRIMEDESEPITCEEEKKEGPSTTTTSKEFRELLLEENKPGKVYVRGYDKDGRAVVYMRPGRENTNNELNNMRHLVWNMEKAIAITKRNGHSKIVFVIDYQGFSLYNAPPLSTSRYTLDIMQKHYPERCHRFYLTHPPFIFKALWAAVRPFVDPHTKEKMVFCSGQNGIATLLDELGDGDGSKLEKCAGGTDLGALKAFEVNAYFDLPMEEGFDDESWPKFNNKK